MNRKSILPWRRIASRRSGRAHRGGGGPAWRSGRSWIGPHGGPSSRPGRRHRSRRGAGDRRPGRGTADGSRGWPGRPAGPRRWPRPPRGRLRDRRPRPRPSPGRTAGCALSFFQAASSSGRQARPDAESADQKTTHITRSPTPRSTIGSDVSRSSNRSGGARRPRRRRQPLAVPVRMPGRNGATPPRRSP